MKASRKWMGIASGLFMGLIPWSTGQAQSITGTAHFDAADKLVSWTFDFDKGSSTAILTHMVLGFRDGSGVPDSFWNSAGSISVSSSSGHAVSVVDVWPDNATGTSFLELNFNSSINLASSGTVTSFSFLTGTAESLTATPNYFVTLYSGGPASMNITLDGTQVATANLTVSAADLSAIPEPASWAVWLGATGLMMGVMRRRSLVITA